MLLNVPDRNDYLVVRQPIKSPGGGDDDTNPACYVQVVNFHLAGDYLSVPMDLEVGDWFKVSTIHAIKRWQLATWINSVSIGLETKVADKDRKWFRERLPSKAKYISRTVDVRPLEINGKIEIYKLKADALARSAELKGTTLEVSKTLNRFRSIG